MAGLELAPPLPQSCSVEICVPCLLWQPCRHSRTDSVSLRGQILRDAETGLYNCGQEHTETVHTGIQVMTLWLFRIGHLISTEFFLCSLSAVALKFNRMWHLFSSIWHMVRVSHFSVCISKATGPTWGQGTSQVKLLKVTDWQIGSKATMSTVNQDAS